MSSKNGAKELPFPKTPEISFSEKEVQNVADFVNFVYKRAKWDLSSQESLDLGKHLKTMSEHIKKIEAYIFEFKKVIQKPKD